MLDDLAHDLFVVAPPDFVECVDDGATCDEHLADFRSGGKEHGLGCRIHVSVRIGTVREQQFDDGEVAEARGLVQRGPFGCRRLVPCRVGAAFEQQSDNVVAAELGRR